MRMLYVQLSISMWKIVFVLKSLLAHYKISISKFYHLSLGYLTCKIFPMMHQVLEINLLSRNFLINQLIKLIKEAY